MSEERIQKILSRAGLASRREAERLILEGRVLVNGRPASLGDRADPDRDAVKVDGRKVVLRSGGSLYLLMNKPRGVVTTVRDPEGRRTVADLWKEAGYRQRLFPVGRLDFDAEGLLLVTNDGEMAHAVLHPSRGLPKLYLVKVRGQPDRKSLARLRRGLPIGKGVRTRPAKVEIARPGDNPWLEITLKEGRPNQIKRMLERVGHRVLRLRRTAIGPLRLRGLRPAEVRPLRPEELARLRKVLEGGKRGSASRPLDATP